jgi:hypothetical protein
LARAIQVQARWIRLAALICNDISVCPKLIFNPL